MAPRRQPSRQAQIANAPLDSEVIAKRTKRHLEELERSNYSEPTGAAFLLEALDEQEEGAAPAGRSTKARARQAVISDKRDWTGGGGGGGGANGGGGRRAAARKSSMAVRTAVLYKKSLAVLLDESGIAQMPAGVPTYLTAAAPPPPEPPRMFCSVCGYWGKYRCKRCAMPYCDMNCEGIHNEARCERRVV